MGADKGGQAVACRTAPRSVVVKITEPAKPMEGRAGGIRTMAHDETNRDGNRAGALKTDSDRDGASSYGGEGGDAKGGGCWDSGGLPREEEGVDGSPLRVGKGVPVGRLCTRANGM